VIVSSTLRPEVALILRRVRALHEAQGSPDCPALGDLWTECERELAAFRYSGDDVLARVALARYEHFATLAIRKAAK
jgi:hypothetical protein